MNLITIFLIVIFTSSVGILINYYYYAKLIKIKYQQIVPDINVFAQQFHVNKYYLGLG